MFYKRKEKGSDLTPWRPLKDLADLWDIFDRAWDEWGFLPRGFHRTQRNENLWYPAVDVMNQKDQIVAKAELPGVKKEDVKVSVDDGYLTLSGEKKFEETVEKEDYCHTERSYGSFVRTVDLPSSVDPTQAKATYKDGVLEIVLPKIEKDNGKKQIPIE